MDGKVLLVGDMHLGRLPAHLPAVLQEYDLQPHSLGPAAAWQKVVEFARANQVDAVLLAGDLVEAENARFEAFGHLSKGVQDLVDDGIDVCAVAGNHDVEALPRLARLLAGFHLLGAEGTWSYHPLSSAGGQWGWVLGWSFPRADVAPRPFLEPPPPPPDERPILGLLHCDLDAAGSPYAPVRRRELDLTGLAGWFLGHIHKPSLPGGDPPTGYLGSLVGLDPTETGLHGPWLARIAAGRIRELNQIPLAPLRWESLAISVDGLTDPQTELEGLLVSAMRDLQARLADQSSHTQAIGCRVRLTGRAPAALELDRFLAGRPFQDLAFYGETGQVLMFLAKILPEYLPALDLERLAAGQDPPALLARQLVLLQTRGPGYRELIQEARDPLQAAAVNPNFAALTPFDDSEERVRELLLRSGFRALAELLAQRERVP